MANLVKVFVILYSLVRVKTISAQEDDLCSFRTKHGKCVDLNFCPDLRDLAHAPVLSTQEKKFLNRMKCGERKVWHAHKVCCENPSFPTPSIPRTTVTTPGTVITTKTTPPAIVENQSPINNITSQNPLKNMTLPGIDICGMHDLEQKIFNGTLTELDQFPWAVALEYRNVNQPGVKCGGTLINTLYVITAAHCVARVQKNDLIARLGEWDLEMDPDCDDDENCNPQVIFAEIAEIKIHPQYRQRQNDIALLKLLKALPEDYYEHIRPICLPKTADLIQNSFINIKVTVVGWGTTELEQTSRYKMFTNLVTISVDQCQNELQKTATRPKLYESHICAKSNTGFFQDACRGDSGGPLTAYVNGFRYLIGVVAFGPPCGKTLLPGVYTRVTSYMDWIENNLVE